MFSTRTHPPPTLRTLMNIIITHPHHHYHHHHHHHHHHRIDGLGCPSVYSMHTWGDWRWCCPWPLMSEVCITLLLINNNYISSFHWMMLFICYMNRMIPLISWTPSFVDHTLSWTADTGPSLATDRGWVWVWHGQTGCVASELTVAPSSRPSTAAPSSGYTTVPSSRPTAAPSFI